MPPIPEIATGAPREQSQASRGETPGVGPAHGLAIVARRELFATGDSGSRNVLLEGSWPGEWGLPKFHSLDDALDGQCVWIDALAARLAEQLAGDGAAGLSAAHLNLLALRYYLVRPLRLVAYFTEAAPLARGEEVQLAASRPRDADYAEVLRQLCLQAGASLAVRWIAPQPQPPSAFPANGLWRRFLAAADGLLPRVGPPGGGTEPRMIFCGNPRLLDPVCGEMAKRGARAWWLYDRFAVQAWFRWRFRGVGQLVCDSSRGRENRLELPAAAPIMCRGIDLGPTVRAWLAHRAGTHGARQTRLAEQIDRHFRAVRPHAVILDEDATPMARAAVAAARRWGAATYVVQHGLPVCRFGFAPLAADRALVWGTTSQGVFTGWGVPEDRVCVTGQPRLEHFRRDGAKRLRRLGPQRSSLRRILLLAIRPPQADRPEPVGLRMTARRYAEMIRAGFEAAAQRPGTRLIVKAHPRAGADPAIAAASRAFPQLAWELVTRGTAESLFDRVDCAVSCGSTAGVEAALAGLPVVALAPPGASEFPTHESWGLAGTAHDARELAALLEDIFSGRLAWKPPGDAVLAEGPRWAASRIADVVLQGAERASSAPP